eukprot:TRINITY_DN19880_c0_g1_i1.p1 TRINITY_DN19880_c0_g1~~TRINITY_DN19880_c0_g1_i1.p1  ORF type:complete len:449 (-),score=66.01 TRINITY_DN19880_c0_g1_i1:175-1521(-)
MTAMSDMHISQWELGVVASILGTFFLTIGIQLRILAGIGLLRKGRKLALEASGWVLWIFGQGLLQVAIALAPATINACMSFTGALLWNAFLAPLVLKETLTKAHFIGMVLLASGGILVTYYASHEDHKYSQARFWILLERGPFVGMAGVCYFIVFIIAVYGYWRRSMDVFCFAYVYALVGATDMIVTKYTLQFCGSYATNLSEVEDHPSLPGLAVFVTLMISLHLGVLACQAVSTGYGEALKNMPLFLASGTVLQITISGTFYNEFSDFGPVRAAAFGTGLFLIFAGLLCTASADPARGNASENADTEEWSLNEELLDVLEDAEEGEKDEEDPEPTVRVSKDTDTSPASAKHVLAFTMGSMCHMDLERTAMCFNNSRQLFYASKNSFSIRRAHSEPSRNSRRRQTADGPAARGEPRRHTTEGPAAAGRGSRNDTPTRSCSTRSKSYHF